jgi:hypothetical protein
MTIQSHVQMFIGGCAEMDAVATLFERENNRVRNNYANTQQAVQLLINTGHLDPLLLAQRHTSRISEVRQVVFEHFGYFPLMKHIGRALSAVSKIPVQEEETMRTAPQTNLDHRMTTTAVQGSHEMSEKGRLKIGEALIELCQEGVLPYAYEPHVALTALGPGKCGGFYEWLFEHFPELAPQGKRRAGNQLRKWGVRPWKLRKAGLSGLEFPPLGPLRYALDECFGDSDWNYTDRWQRAYREYPYRFAQ